MSGRPGGGRAAAPAGPGARCSDPAPAAPAARRSTRWPTGPVAAWPRDDGHGHAARQGRRTSAARSGGCSARSRPERPLIVGRGPARRSSAWPSTSIGPKILGNAINTIFEGALGKQTSPAGHPGAGDRRGCARRARTSSPTCCRAMHLTPGRDRLRGARRRRSCSWSASTSSARSSAGSRAGSWPGSPSGPSFALRTDVDQKLGRLPLRYFDSHPRGDLLSRVTNDIDNIGQSLQQSLTQLITSLLTIVGVLILMLTISPILAVVSLLAVPGLDRRDDPHRPALAAAVRRPVGVDRRAERARRGDAHRPLDREGRSAGSSRRSRRSIARTRASTRPAVPGPVHLRARSSPR